MEKTKLIYGYDLETFPNIFTAVFIDRNTKKEIRIFEISERKNELESMMDFLKHEVKGLIGYNNLHFDSQIIEWFIDNKRLWTSDYNQILPNLMLYVDSIIKSRYPSIPEWKLKIKNLDVFKYMHFDRFGVSLKWCEYMLDSPNLEDLPNKPGENVPIEDFDKLIEYNINDVIETLRVYEYSKDDINLRKTLSKAYHKDLMNKSNTGIGKVIMLDGYSKITNTNPRTILDNGNTERDVVLIGDVIDDRVEFKTKILKDFLNSLRQSSINLVTDRVSFEINTLTCKHEFGKGGLHSICKKGVYESTKDTTIVDVDWGSYYPSLMIKLGIYPEHLGSEFLTFLKDLTDRRLEAKRTKDTITDKSLKISINSVYGLLGEIYNWMHDYKALYSVTINGQLILLMLIEELELIDSRIKCYYSNTDGATFIVPNELLDKFKEVGENFRNKYFDAELEYVYFKKQVLSDVNNFIVIKQDGKTKEKGKFISDEKELTLNKNKSFMCVPKALKEYFTNGTPIIDSLKANDNIFDFCAGKRAKKTPKADSVNFELTEIIDGEVIVKKLSKTIRYYVSNEGLLLQKVSYDEQGNSFKKEMVEAHPIKGMYYKIQMFNKFVDKEDYNIDYKFYERMCNRIIRDIESDKYQLKMF